MLISKYLEEDVANGRATLTGRMVARNGRLWVEAVYEGRQCVWYADATVAAYYGLIFSEELGNFADEPADPFGY